MSSGSSHASRRRFPSFFFDDLLGPFDEDGRQRVERGAEANKVLEACGADGVRKSI